MLNHDVIIAAYGFPVRYGSYGVTLQVLSFANPPSTTSPTIIKKYKRARALSVQTYP